MSHNDDQVFSAGHVPSRIGFAMHGPQTATGRGTGPRAVLSVSPTDGGHVLTSSAAPPDPLPNPAPMLCPGCHEVLFRTLPAKPGSHSSHPLFTLPPPFPRSRKLSSISTPQTGADYLTHRRKSTEWGMDTPRGPSPMPLHTRVLRSSVRVQLSVCLSGRLIKGRSSRLPVTSTPSAGPLS